MSTIKVSAVAAGIDASQRGVTLTLASGKVVDITAGPAFKNFDPLAVVDKVSAEGSQALPLARKRAGNGMRKSGVRGGLRVTGLAGCR